MLSFFQRVSRNLRNLCNLRTELAKPCESPCDAIDYELGFMVASPSLLARKLMADLRQHVT